MILADTLVAVQLVEGCQDVIGTLSGVRGPAGHILVSPRRRLFRLVIVPIVPLPLDGRSTGQPKHGGNLDRTNCGEHSFFFLRIFVAFTNARGHLHPARRFPVVLPREQPLEAQPPSVIAQDSLET